jgi:hypothetical protein
MTFLLFEFRTVRISSAIHSRALSDNKQQPNDKDIHSEKVRIVEGTLLNPSQTVAKICLSAIFHNKTRLSLPRA